MIIMNSIILFLIILTSFPTSFGSGLSGGSPVFCEKEGVEVEVPWISSDPCISCKCQANKQVKCDREICPSRKSCYLLLHGQDQEKKSCCDACKGCFYKGKRYANDEEWVNPEDPCKLLTCQGGIVTETSIQCYTSCRNPIPPEPGKCCPTCADCSIDNSKTKEIELPLPLTDPCVTCTCKGNSSTCSKKACPVLPCPLTKHVFKRGVCCPECFGNRRLYSSEGKCFLGTREFRSGDEFQQDSCTLCKCHNSTIHCSRKSCPALDCWPEHQIKDPEDCCARCKSPEEKKAICMHDGKVLEDGYRWQLEKCKHCMCRDGQVDCVVEPCETQITCPAGHTLKTRPGDCCPSCVEDDGVCTVFGDPHYRTFDGKIFNYQGSCKYVLSKDCINRSFSVEVLNEARFSKSFSWTKSVTIKVNGTKIRLGQYMKIHVNHKPVKLPYIELGVLTVFQEDRNVLVRTNLGMKVLWDGNSYLEVSVPSFYKDTLCGLCGNYNGDEKDDFKTKNGRLVRTAEDFGNSWRVGKMKRCIMSQPTSTNTSRYLSPDARVRIIRECNVLKSSVFKPCHKTVSAVDYYKSCFLDAGECRPRDRCYCQSLTAYARQCTRAGLELGNWRTTTGCDGMRCGNGQQYMNCAPTCRRTCKKPKRDKSCRKHCRPGCYCPPGTVWHRKQCIPVDDCPS
ncbi:BMP-binding endothelial regulator protein [Parasteatoda tepidariorum]|uniref:BMP-binding endothelial regulator protein n=1 Tax=Parasteatoda tepidariorum TaxID=114398 RepID=UPI00077FDBB6|nr:BMP-binding endothelial regulator protein [Parasteatoda tepidariorum]